MGKSLRLLASQVPSSHPISSSWGTIPFYEELSPTPSKSLSFGLLHRAREIYEVPIDP
jgi:hypothetical protein